MQSGKITAEAKRPNAPGTLKSPPACSKRVDARRAIAASVATDRTSALAKPSPQAMIAERIEVFGLSLIFASRPACSPSSEENMGNMRTDLPRIDGPTLVLATRELLFLWLILNEAKEEHATLLFLGCTP